MSKNAKFLPYIQSCTISMPAHSQHAGKHKALICEVTKLCEYSAKGAYNRGLCLILRSRCSCNRYFKLLSSTDEHRCKSYSNTMIISHDSTADASLMILLHFSSCFLNIGKIIRIGRTEVNLV